MKCEITVTALHPIKNGDLFEAKWVFVADVDEEDDEYTSTRYSNLGASSAFHCIKVRKLYRVGKKVCKERKVCKETRDYVLFAIVDWEDYKNICFFCYKDALLRTSLPKPYKE
jgi:hypothetical protein